MGAGVSAPALPHEKTLEPDRLRRRMDRGKGPGIGKYVVPRCFTKLVVFTEAFTQAFIFEKDVHDFRAKIVKAQEKQERGRIRNEEKMIS